MKTRPTGTGWHSSTCWNDPWTRINRARLYPLLRARSGDEKHGPEVLRPPAQVLIVRGSDPLFNAVKERPPGCGLECQDRPAARVLLVTDPDEAGAKLSHFHTVAVAATVGTLAPYRPHGRGVAWQFFAAATIQPTRGGAASL